MPQSTGTAPNCSICNSPRKAVINAFLAAGRAPTWIEREMKVLGSPTKAETVVRHRLKCLKGKTMQSMISADGVNNHDFAAAIRDEAQRLLDAGEMKIRAEHGLAAQGLLDRRAEHAANRTLLLNIGRLLSGGRTAPAEVIVGEWREIGVEEQLQLAPAELIAVEG